jgi:hypothetical protein
VTPEQTSRGLSHVLTLGSAFERRRVAAGGVIIAARAGLCGKASLAALGYRCTIKSHEGPPRRSVHG